MRGKSLPCYFLILFAAVLLVFGLNRATAEQDKKPTANEIMKKCDNFHFPPNMDLAFKIDVTLIDKKGKKTYLKLENYQKGTKKRLMRFVEPKDIAGFSILSKDVDTLYVYEPSLGKVRRIASHAKKQSMLGLDYTLSESETFRLGSDYDVKLIGEDEKTYHLYLTQKKGQDKSWPILKVYVNKKKWYAAKIEYCNQKGKVKKTETRYKLKKFGGKWATSIMKMVDHAKKHTTIFNITDVKFDQLPDKMFTKRNLVRDE